MAGNAVFVFEDREQRERFFSHSVLERFSVHENTMGTDTNCRICVTSGNGVFERQKALVEIAEVAETFGAECHLDCGGDNLSDCGDHERGFGRLCDFCMFSENRG
tara:strand:+ start:4970 stop:5284 length:315 start_codon:yes stop_codon:yes gene_type:complete